MHRNSRRLRRFGEVSTGSFTLLCLALMLMLVLGAILAAVQTPKAHAAEVQFGGQWSPDGGRQLTGAPIGQTRGEMSVLGQLGPALAGVDIEATQNGRAGEPVARFTLRSGEGWTHGPLTVRAFGLLGYQFANGDDCTLIGGETVALWRPTAGFGIEAAGRYRRCVLINALARNVGQLAKPGFSEPSGRIGPVLFLSPRSAIVWSYERDGGTFTANRIGASYRLTF